MDPHDRPSPSSNDVANQLRVIADVMPAYLAYVDDQLIYRLANRTYETWFGLDASQIVGHFVGDVLGEAYESVRPRFEAALTGVEQHFETQMQTVEGVRHLGVYHIPDRDETSGAIRGVVIHGFDITERKRSEAALMQAEKLAAVGRLASSIAHEINNPLESVVNLLYLIEHTTLNDPEQSVRYAILAQQELARVSQITTQTLRFFKQSTAPAVTNIAALIETVLALYQGRLANSGIAVERQFSVNIEGVCFEGELHQIVNNLVGNAIDAMPGGGRLIVRARVRSGRDGSGTLLRLTIADTGTGMDGATLGRVFEPFFTTKGILGTGLGLWVSQQLVEKHCGRLAVSSRRTLGTVFVLDLPFLNLEQNEHKQRDPREIESTIRA